MTGKKITEDIQKQLSKGMSNSIFLDIIDPKKGAKILTGEKEKPSGKEASPIYKGKTTLPTKKTERGVVIDASPKEIAEFVKTSGKVKGMVKTINFDTLGDDINNLNKKILSIDGGWKSKKEMDSIFTSVKDMKERLGLFEEYRKKYGKTDLSDLSELKTAYDRVLKDWEDISNKYAKYNSAEEYEKDSKKTKELYSMSSEDIQNKKNDKDYIKKVNSVYDTAKEYKKELEQLRVELGLEEKWPSASTNRPSTQDLIKEKEKELNDFLKKEGYNSFEELENAKNGAAYTTAYGYAVTWDELYNEAKRREQNSTVSYDELKKEYDAAGRKAWQGEESSLKNIWTERNSIAFNMVKSASDEELDELIKDSINRENAIFKAQANGTFRTYNDNYDPTESEKALRAYIEKEKQDRKINRDATEKLRKWQKDIDWKNSEYVPYEDETTKHLVGDDKLYHYVNNEEFRKTYVDAPGQKTSGEIWAVAEYREKGYHLLTSEERLTFNAIWKEKGADKAIEFLKDLEKVLNKRASDVEVIEEAKWAEKHQILGSAKSVALNVFSGVEVVDNIIDSISGKGIDTYDSTGRISRNAMAARQAISQKIAQGSGGQAGAFLYDIGMSIADFTVNAFLLKGAGSAAGASAKLTNSLTTLNMSLSASANAMIDAADRGGSDLQIALSGLASGVAEYAFEKISIEKLFSSPKLVSKKALAGFIVQQIITEGSEEGFTEIANIIADAVIMGGRSNNALKVENYVLNGMSYEDAAKKVLNENIVQVAMSTAGGMISGGVVGSVVGGFNYNATQSDIKARGADVLKGKTSANDIDLTVEAGLEYGKDTDIYKQAEKVKNKIASGETITKKDIGTLTYLMENASADGNTEIDGPDFNERTVENANRVKFSHIMRDYNASKRETMYKYVGKTSDNRKIYKSNYPANTPKSVKQTELISLVQNAWSKKDIELTLNTGEKIRVKFDPELSERSDLSKIAFGNRKGNGSEKRITSNLFPDLYEIAEDSTHTYGKDEEHNGKENNPAHNDVKRWEYFVTNLVYEEEDGTQIDCYMNIDVKRTTDGDYFYSFAIEKGTAPQTLLAVVTEQNSATDPSNNNVPQEVPAVNSYSMRNGINNSQTPLPQGIVNGNKTTEALYRDASLGNISLQLAKMGYLDSDLKDVAQTLVNYAKGEISAVEVERILSIPQADSIAQMIEQDVNLRELIADPKAQNTASEETLGEIVKKAKASKNETELFRSEIDLFYAAGKNNISYAEVEKMYNAKSLSSDERMAAYYRGLENAQRVYTFKNGNIVEKKINGSVKGGLLVNDEARRLTNLQKRYLMKLGETLGKTITIQDNLRNSDGKRVSGFINDTAVFIDANVKDPIMWTATHEFSHQMQKLAPKEWAKYRDYVIKLKEKNGTYDDDLEAYEDAYGKTSETELQDEMACDYTDQLFKNEKDLLDFINHSKSLATRVKDIWFKVLDKLNISHKEDARSLWEKCYKEASREARKGVDVKSGSERYKIIMNEDISTDEYLKQQMQDWRDGHGKKHGKYNGSYFELGDTPKSLINHGVSSSKMIMLEECLIKVTGGKHAISTDEIAKLPSQLAEPILLFKSKYKDKKGHYQPAFVALTEMVDIHGNDVVAIVHINKYQDRILVNRIASLYSKTDEKTYENRIENYVSQQIENGNLIDASNKKAPIWFTSRGLQLPKLVQTIIDANNNVSQDEPVVNSHSMQNGGNNSQNGRSRISSAAEATRKNRESDRKYEKLRGAIEQMKGKSEGGIVVNEHSIALKKKDITSYVGIQKMAQDLEMKAIIVKGLFEDSEQALDGIITPQGVFIDADAENPARFVATHEFSHRMKQAAAKDWKRYQDYVIKVLKKKTLAGTNKTAYDVLYDVTRKAYGDKTDDYIHEEIAANHIGELFDNEAELIDFIRTDRSLAQKVKAWWNNVLSMFGLNGEKEKAKAMWLRAYKKAVKQVQSGKVGEFSEEVRYSKEYTFNKQIDDAIGKKMKSGFSVYVGKLPNLLCKCGLDPALPMLMHQGHIRNIEHKKDSKHREFHGISKDIIKQVPKLIKRPAAIYDSISELNKENSICVLTTKCDEDGNPIIVIVENSTKDSSYLNVKMEIVKVKKSNFVDSMYGREGFFDHISSVIDKDAILYSSKDGMEKLFAEMERMNQKNKNPKLNSDSKLELLTRLDNLGFDTIIHPSRNVVNNHSTQNDGNNSRKAVRGTRLSELVEEYGAIEPGAGPRRDVSVPKRTKDGNRVSRFARTAAEATTLSDEVADSVLDGVADGKFSYTPVSNDGALGEANASYDLMGQEWCEREVMGKVQAHNLDKKTIALAEVLLQKYSENGEVEKANELIVEIAAEGTRMGQSIQALSMLKKLSDDYEIKYVDKVVEKLKQDILKRYKGKKSADIVLSDEVRNQIMSARTQEEKNVARERAFEEIASQLPKSWENKWNAWRYIAMLANTRTHIRNFVGNAFFVPMVTTKNVAGAIFEGVIDRVSSEGIVRTKALVIPKEYKDFAKNDLSEVEDILTGGGKNNASSVIQDKQKVFNTRFFEWLRVTNEKLLNKEDLVFLRHHYKKAFAGYLAANKVDLDNIDERTLTRARNYALRQAQMATYRDMNAFSSAVSKLNRIDNKGLRLVIEGVIPFKKTPANVLMRGLEYSPAGLVKAMWNGATKLRKGQMTSSEFIEEISAGLTGTGVVALGFMLSSLGFIVGAPEDDELKEFEELQGKQSYALVIGDHSYTIDWLAPLALPLFVGVEMQRLFEERGNLEAKDYYNAITNLAEPMFELSMLSGLSDTISTIGTASTSETSRSILEKTVTGYFGQAVPTLFSQVARVIDDTTRKYYYDENSALPRFAQYFTQTQMKKIPGMSNKLEPYVDEWGREKVMENVFGRVLQNFFSPGYYSKIKSSGMEDELKRLFIESNGEYKVFPKTASKEFTLDNGEKIVLSAEEYTKTQKVQGQTAYNILSSIMDSGVYDLLEYDEYKAALVEKVYALSTAKAKKEVAGDRYTPKDAWIRNALSMDEDERNDYLVFSVVKNKEFGGKAAPARKYARDNLDNLSEEFWLNELSDVSDKRRADYETFIRDTGISAEDYMQMYDYYNSLKVINKDQPNEIGIIDQMADYLNKTDLSLDTKVKIGITLGGGNWSEGGLRKRLIP